MGEDNNETVDSLDNDDKIEDSEDLDGNQDSTEGDIQDSLDTEGSIDSDDTDDSVEEGVNNEQGPLDSEDSSLVEATYSNLTNGTIPEKEKHISEVEARKAFENKFHEIASSEASWNTPKSKKAS